MDKEFNFLTNKLISKWASKPMNERTNEKIEGRTNEWKNELVK